jgi:hypothetical protein
LMGASSNFEWYVDECGSARVRGWIVDLRTLVPAEVSFLSEGQTIFQITAGGTRLDVQRAGRGVQFCGIDVALDPKIWDRLEGLQIVLTDGSIFASISKPSDAERLTPSILDNYGSAPGRPMRIKAFPSPGDSGASVVRKSLCLSSDDTSFMETMVFPESALPCFIVINDEFVTLLAAESNSRAAHEQRQLVGSIDELTHIRLTADAVSNEENYAVFSGDFFELPRNIIVCYSVTIPKT